MVRQGEKVEARWTRFREKVVEELGWTELSDGEILERALMYADELTGIRKDGTGKHR